MPNYPLSSDGKNQDTTHMLSLITLLLRPILWLTAIVAPVATSGSGTFGNTSTASQSLGQWRRGHLFIRVQSLLRLWPLVLELGGLALWAAWVGRRYLDFSPATWPSGGEFPMAIQGHIVWSWLAQCGDCVLWNGSLKGGSPAFIDLHGAVTHPLIVVTTLLWGAVVGAKVTLVVCLFLGGLAQCWLARLLNLGRFARLWSAALAVVAGHLAGRMEVGVVGVVLSTAFASLAMVAGFALARSGGRRLTVAFAMLLALTITAGQGYVQIGFAVAILPALGLLLLDKQLQFRPTWREFVVAGGLALLLSAVFLVPLLHYWPSIGKDADPSFDSAQVVDFVPLNLVIDDEMFYRSDTLGKQPYPYLYVIYIGWIPVLFALAALRLVPSSEVRTLLCFLIGIALVFITSSGLPFQLLQPLAPQLMASVRNPSLIAGLAIPLILGLGAWGLDAALRDHRLQLGLMLRGSSGPLLSASWLLVVPAIWSIAPVYSFNQRWLTTTTADPTNATARDFLIGKSPAWVQSPYGEGFWLPELLTAGVKLADVTRPWSWKGYDNPLPALELTRDQQRAEAGTIEGETNGLFLVSHPESSYAAVSHGNTATPCTATSLGGHIDVVCSTSSPGTLVVQEHQGPGWQVWVDGAPARLTESQWLTMPVAEGSHQYSFRYHPWDVPVGIILTLIGLAVAWWYSGTTPRVDALHDDAQAAGG